MKSSLLDLDGYGLDDDDKGSGGNDAPLSWRLDCSDSLSDWTIVVSKSSNKSAQDSTTYHVHKNILAVGPRSEYFASLFKGRHEVSEQTMSTSVITLEDSAADAFPVMLDFIYEGNGEANLDTSKAVALRHLAQYFRIRSLYEVVTCFIQNDLVADTATTYLSEAVKYHDEKLASAAEDLCAKNMGEINPARFLVLSSDLMKRIFASKEMTCESKALSKIVAKYCEGHLHDVDFTLFKSMASEQNMPQVDPESALSLLNLFVTFKGGESGNSGEHIKTRCIEAASKSWENVMLKSMEISAASCESGQRKRPATDTITHRDLPRKVQIDLLEASLVLAKNDLDQSNMRLRSCMSEKRSLECEKERLTTKVTKLKKKLQKYT